MWTKFVPNLSFEFLFIGKPICNGANGQMTITVHNYRPRQFHRTSNGENPSSGCRDMGSENYRHFRTDTGDHKVTNGQTDRWTGWIKSIHSFNFVMGGVAELIHHTAIHDKYDLYINSTLCQCIDLESSFNSTNHVICLEVIKFKSYWKSAFGFDFLHKVHIRVLGLWGWYQDLSRASYSRVYFYKCS